MQKIKKGNHPSKATISFLPMIDLSPSDMSCINTTLHFLSEKATKYGFHPIITFDQPLFWKALQIITNEDVHSPLSSIVLRLGGLHTEISFLGAIGFLMQGSGLEDILEVIYPKNTVPHMLSGKDISRAIRGHFSVDSVLNAMLLAKAYNLSIPLQENAVVDNSQEFGNDDLILPEELKCAKELFLKAL